MANRVLTNQEFEDLFRSQFANLVGYVYGFVKDEETAKDIVHDAFTILWEQREKLDGSYSFKSYLFTLAQNHALNYLRHQRVVEVNERELGEWLQSASEEYVEYEQRLSLLEKKLPELPNRQREVLQKCIVEGKKYQEVAEELGISLTTVKTHVVRALQFLRAEVRNSMLLIFVWRKMKKN